MELAAGKLEWLSILLIRTGCLLKIIKERAMPLIITYNLTNFNHIYVVSSQYSIEDLMYRNPLLAYWLCRDLVQCEYITQGEANIINASNRHISFEESIALMEEDFNGNRD